MKTSSEPSKQRDRDMASDHIWRDRILKVSGIPPSTTLMQLQSTLSQFGAIERYSEVLKLDDGTASVVFESAAGVRAARDTLVVRSVYINGSRLKHVHLDNPERDNLRQEYVEAREPQPLGWFRSDESIVPDWATPEGSDTWSAPLPQDPYALFRQSKSAQKWHVSESVSLIDSCWT